MILKVINHDFIYEMSHLCTVFFPFEKIKEDGEDNIEVVTSANGNEFSVYARVYDKSLIKTYKLKVGDDAQTQMSVLLFNVLCEITGFKPPWGILFGVRPAKLMHRYVEELGEERARNHFINTFLASPQKTDLALEVMHRENKIISLSSHNSFSLYVSIPFCPTRCAYCSFVSHSIEKTHKLLEPYVNLLCSELEKTGHIAKQLGLRLETIYFGGGTPTTLSASQLKKLFDVISDNFDLSALREYTVEAGRPDTVTQDKLIALKNAKVGRISINPQTFNDDVLNTIGRRHTSHQTVEAFELAKKCGFDNINTDLIAGLPTDTPESFKNSLDSIVRLNAECITVHTLCMKRASRLTTEGVTLDLQQARDAREMLAYTQNILGQNEYIPYYMYRQSRMVGNLENVGWSKKGFESLYNVYVMDETHTILACGSGGVTKLKRNNPDYLERIFNFKYPYEYIDRFDELIQRKSGIMQFYGQ